MSVSFTDDQIAEGLRVLAGQTSEEKRADRAAFRLRQEAVRLTLVREAEEQKGRDRDGQVAYEAWQAWAAVAQRGQDEERWSDLPDWRKQAWREVAQAVRRTKETPR